jgi:hypothetical protein
MPFRVAGVRPEDTAGHQVRVVLDDDPDATASGFPHLLGRAREVRPVDLARPWLHALPDELEAHDAGTGVGLHLLEGLSGVLGAAERQETVLDELRGSEDGVAAQKHVPTEGVDEDLIACGVDPRADLGGHRAGGSRVLGHGGAAAPSTRTAAPHAAPRRRRRTRPSLRTIFMFTDQAR